MLLARDDTARPTAGWTTRLCPDPAGPEDRAEALIAEVMARAALRGWPMRFCRHRRAR